MAQIFPQELYDLFIDDIDSQPSPSQRLQDLRSCAGVSRAFRSRARGPLFRYIEILLYSGNLQSAPIRNLVEIFKNDEVVRQSVQSLGIIIRRNNGSIYNLDLMDLLGLLSRDLFMDIQLVFKVESENEWTEFRWEDFGMNLRSAFFDFFERRNVTSIVIGNEIDLPVELVGRLQGLKVLEIDGCISCITTTGPSEPLVGDLACPQLHTLKVHNLGPYSMSYIFGRRRQDKIFSNLKTLVLSCHLNIYREYGMALDLLIRCERSLEHLSLKELISCQDKNTVLSMPNFSVLKTVNHHETNLLPRTDDLESFTPLFEAYTSSQHLQSITLDFSWVFDWRDELEDIRDALSDLKVLKATEWKTLDALLGNLPVLNKVVLHLRFTIEDREGDLTELVVNHLLDTTTFSEWEATTAFPLTSSRLGPAIETDVSTN